MDVLVIIGIFLAGLGLGISLFAKGMYCLWKKHLIETITTSKIRSLAMGMVEVCGVVEAAKGNTLKSPLERKRCVYYEFLIEGYKSSGESQRWHVIDRFTEGAYFFLKDSTGAVLVEPSGAEVDIKPSYSCLSGPCRIIPDAVKGYMARNDFPYKQRIYFSGELRFTESIIQPGDKLYILGYAGDNPFVKEASAKNSVEDIMIQGGGLGKVYFISDKPEKETLDKLKTKWMGGVFGGSALIVFSLLAFMFFTNAI
ncbi:hypothetical protein JXB28_03145 [Candidatus Woesearchaeota archaeon]|nr:hypothetical protein [Candidatus Woesearchaeota archaeon]